MSLAAILSPTIGDCAQVISSPACWGDRTLVCEKGELCRTIKETWEGGHCLANSWEKMSEKINHTLLPSEVLLPTTATRDFPSLQGQVYMKEEERF